jgi:hypothetical protein
MSRRFARSMAVAGTIGLSSLGAAPAAVAVTAPVAHSVQAPGADAGTEVGAESDDEQDEQEPSVVDLTTAADAIGVDLPALRAALRDDGATLAAVAQVHGVPAERLETALVAEASRRLDEAALAGRLSPWEAQERRTVLPDVIAAAVLADRSLGAA